MKYLGTGERHIFREPGQRFFLLSGRYEISPELYSSTNRFNSGLRFKLTEQLVGIGKSTLQIHSSMKDMASNKTLAQFKFSYCLVNLSIRKSEQLPDWFRATFSSFTEPGISFKPQPLPVDKAFSLQHTVTSSDIDMNQHMNNSIYIRWCFDCGSLAMQNQRLRHFNRKNLSQYRAKTFDVVYNRESVEGEKLTVYVWEDEATVGILHFQINCDAVRKFYGRASFFDFSDAKL